jgi:hypothetical protein
MYKLEEIEALPMPVGWFDNQPILEALSGMVRSRAEAVSVIDQLGPSTNLNAVGCLLATVRRYCVENHGDAIPLLLRLFSTCRYKDHALFMNTFLPFLADLLEEYEVAKEQEGAMFEVCEAALVSVEAQSAYGLRNPETLRLAEWLINKLRPGPRAVKAVADLMRVKRLYDLRWATKETWDGGDRP